MPGTGISLKIVIQKDHKHSKETDDIKESEIGESNQISEEFIGSNQNIEKEEDIFIRHRPETVSRSICEAPIKKNAQNIQKNAEYQFFHKVIPIVFTVGLHK